jgi:hypothetical protein
LLRAGAVSTDEDLLRCRCDELWCKLFFITIDCNASVQKSFFVVRKKCQKEMNVAVAAILKGFAEGVSVHRIAFNTLIYID